MADPSDPTDESFNTTADSNVTTAQEGGTDAFGPTEGGDTVQSEVTAEGSADPTDSCAEDADDEATQPSEEADDKRKDKGVMDSEGSTDFCEESDPEGKPSPNTTDKGEKDKKSSESGGLSEGTTAQVTVTVTDGNGDREEAASQGTSSAGQLAIVEGKSPGSNVPSTNVKSVATGERMLIGMDTTVTVKFLLIPCGQIVTVKCTRFMKMLEQKQIFSKQLGIPKEYLVFTYKSIYVPDDYSFGEIGAEEYGTVTMEMCSVEPTSHPIKPFTPDPPYTMPDIIRIKTVQGDGTKGDIFVGITRFTQNKPFLGGFRNKANGLVLHHAAAQTMKKSPYNPNIVTVTRETQYKSFKSTIQQTTNDTSTQMTNIGVYVANVTDKFIIPQKYTTAEEYHATRLTAVRLIQRIARGYLARNFVNRLRAQKNARLDWERMEETKNELRKERRLWRQYDRRMNPRTQDDFSHLFEAVQKWYMEELHLINSTLSGAERKAALCVLLEKETKLLSAIDHHKADACQEIKHMHVKHFLDKTAAPKKFRGFDGYPTYIYTPYIIRARQLRDIYQSLNMRLLTKDERLDVLLSLKQTVREHDCELTRNIIELVNREAELLIRGVRERFLEGLRQRIATLFVQYIKTPIFNPEASRFRRLPPDHTMLMNNVHLCMACNRFLTTNDFPLTTNSSRAGKCKRCRDDQNRALDRKDTSKFRKMLRRLQKSEGSFVGSSGYAFLMQENDIRYLVESIWEAQSAMSGWEHLEDLVLARWHADKEWTPWNCILLTEEEAANHERIDMLESHFGEDFLRKIRHRHWLGRLHFDRLPNLAQKLRSRMHLPEQEEVVSFLQSVKQGAFKLPREPALPTVASESEMPRHKLSVCGEREKLGDEPSSSSVEKEPAVRQSKIASTKKGSRQGKMQVSEQKRLKQAYAMSAKKAKRPHRRPKPGAKGTQPGMPLHPSRGKRTLSKVQEEIEAKLVVAQRKSIVVQKTTQVVLGISISEEAGVPYRRKVQPDQRRVSSLLSNDTSY